MTSNVIDIKTREQKTELTVYIVSDCQGEKNGPDTPERRMSAAGALHRCVSEMISEFGKDFTRACIESEFHRCKP